MKALNLENVKEAGNRDLPAGGYVCKITSVEDVSNKEYLYIEFDVAEGEYKDYFKDLQDRAGFWGGNMYRSYKETALSMFKRFCSATTKSNPGYIFDGGAQNADEKTLVGKLIGLVLYEEEYIKNNGEIGTRLKVSYETTPEKIRNNDFKVKEKVRVPAEKLPKAEFVNVPEGSDDEIPFK